MAMTPAWYPGLLDAYPTLEAISGTLDEHLRRTGVSVNAHAGDVLFEPADFSARFPFVLQGVARVLKVGKSSPDTLLYRLQRGEHCLLSSAGLLGRWRFGARVIAETDLQAVVVPGTLFRDLVRGSREFSHSVHVGIARRLEVVMDLVEQATYFRLDQRVASLILAGGSPMNVSHQEIADDLGVSRENVSRVLGEFRQRGWLKLGRRRIDTVEAQSLEAFLDRDW